MDKDIDRLGKPLPDDLFKDNEYHHQHKLNQHHCFIYDFLEY
jgi:hypothetical protein